MNFLVRVRWHPPMDLACVEYSWMVIAYSQDDKWLRLRCLSGEEIGIPADLIETVIVERKG